MSKKQKYSILSLDENFEQMLISAERYACGRRTYIVRDTITYILGLLPFLSNWCVNALLSDMKNEFMIVARSDGKYTLGDPQDHEEWAVFKQRLEEELKARGVPIE